MTPGVVIGWTIVEAIVFLAGVAVGISMGKLLAADEAGLLQFDDSHEAIMRDKKSIVCRSCHMELMYKSKNLPWQKTAAAKLPCVALLEAP